MKTHNVSPEMKLNSLDRRFGSFGGTGSYYQYWLPSIIYTDGVKDMCEQLNCWHVLDLVASYQGKKPCKNTYLQIWKYRVYDSVATAYCYDNDDIIVAQDIAFTDLQNGEITLKAVWNEVDGKRKLIVCMPVED